VIPEGADPWAFLVSYPPIIRLEPTFGWQERQFLLPDRHPSGIFHPPRPALA
jgi:hypothetical protein